MTFLPTCDLTTCTFINTGWEIEARKRLLTRKTVTLTPNNITLPGTIIPLRGGNRFRNLYMTNFLYSCPTILTDLLSSHAHHVVNLKLHLPLADPNWREYLVHLLTFLHNLGTLHITVVSYRGLIYPKFLPLSQQPRHFWKVRKPEMDSSTWPESSKLVEIVTLFPNLNVLSSDGIEPAVLHKFLHRGPPTLAGPRVTITRLELSDPHFNLGHFSEILQIVAETLESLKFFGMDNCPPHWLMNQASIVFPAMPRLKVFGIRQSPASFRMMSSQCSVVMPRLKFKFGGQSGKLLPVQIHLFYSFIIHEIFEYSLNKFFKIVYWVNIE